MNLLRIEGVNIDATVSDTDDLSTRRGSGLLLLQAIGDVAQCFSKALTRISTGASVGLFQVKPDAPAALANQVENYLRTHALYRHLTFVVDIGTAPSFRAAAESVIAANRWRQMQSFSTALYGLAEEATSACTANGVRPAAPNSPNNFSASVYKRRLYGIEQKQAFYRRELEQLAEPAAALLELHYVNDFQTLTDKLAADWGFNPNIQGKMGVFYADGNRFGHHAEQCETPDELMQWDQHLKTLRRRWLKDLLQTASRRSHWRTPEGHLRLETLLWGGDELTLVVPAWCALELVQHFMQWTADWQHRKAPLTHACGLVLCHANAPIGPIVKLAESLAKLGKPDAPRNDQPPAPNSLHWLTLESFDHAGSDLDHLLRTRFHDRLADWQTLTLGPARLAALTDHLPTLKNVLPRSTLTRAMRLLLRETADHALLERSYLSIHQALLKSQQMDQFNALWQSFHEGPWSQDLTVTSEAPTPDIGHLAAWVTLLELWDYVPLTPAIPDPPDPTPLQPTLAETV
ncbi:MAG TPA: hypothetical protein PKN13_10310 [Accumulibacter sp.]|nr:hypothetical protein [Accumulibacter sp.]HMW17073.1 hypothetical protein [Accumulibacter sp.]HNC18208.1 hypothetical protein [Accumulibacter sp.]HND79874.1 hypothetical protein [Accumulibacter sp.]HNE12269.1 hypothetical protein [Accumulibacter sp.]